MSEAELLETIRTRDATIASDEKVIEAFVKEKRGLETRITELEAGIRAEVAEIPGNVTSRESGLYEDVLVSLALSVGVLKNRITKLEGLLSGDPSCTATKEDRERWRKCAIRYSDKVEADLKTKDAEIKRLRAIPDDTVRIGGNENLRLKNAIQRAEKAEADRDRARQTIKERTAILVRLCGAVGVSTDADEDDLVGAFGAVKAERDRLRGQVARQREALEAQDIGEPIRRGYGGTAPRTSDGLAGEAFPYVWCPICKAQAEGHSARPPHKPTCRWLKFQQALADGAGAPETAVIKAAMEVTEFLNHPIESHGARIQRLWETVQAMLAGKEADRE